MTLELRNDRVGLPARGSLAVLADIQRGLIDDAARGQRTLPPKYFYDLRGSQLFEQITRLPEYYLTRTERALLATRMPEWIAALAPVSLIELGAGSAEKTRSILSVMRRARPDVTYVPVDVSELFLNETASRLRKEFPGLRVEPVVADMSRNITPPPALRHPVLWALLGSTIGNFEDSDAVRLLARMRQSMRSDDRLLLGADLVKSRSVLEAAYNDTQGVTAAFNRNALHVLNRETGADFRPDAFAHRAVFNESDGRIEMYLVSVRDQLVQVPGLPTIRLPRGDSIRTEISNKYSPARLEQMLAQADLDVAQWATDDAGGYALMLAAPKGQ